ncbi:MAG: DUF5343 domain-containing protein [Patescibacteria group bacterium]
MNQENKQITPPYLSMAKLAKLVEIVKSRNMTQVNPTHFITQGFSQADAYVAINSLRFLGLVDDNNNTTDLFRKFQLVGEQGKKGMEEVIKSAYSKLFESFANGNPYDEGNEDNLINDFMIQYAISKRIAGPASKAFVWLCEQAGLREQSIKIQERKIRVTSTKKLADKSNNKNKPQADTKNENPTGVALTLNGGIIISIPTTDIRTSQAIALGELKSAVEELNKFALKYIVETETKNNDAV